MKHKYKSVSIAFSLLISFSIASAATLTGEFTFTKRAPSAAVIYFSDDTSAAAGSIQVDQKDKVFAPGLVMAPKGTKLVFKNSDTIQHNIFAKDRASGVTFDTGMANPGDSTEHNVDWDDDVFVSVGCKIHPKMRLWVGSIKSNYYGSIEFGKKDKSGTIKIENVPDQLKKVKVWLPRFDSLEVEVAKGETKELEVTRKGKPGYGKLKLSFE